jgi:AcrR family transcriptional regulator
MIKSNDQITAVSKPKGERRRPGDSRSSIPRASTATYSKHPLSAGVHKRRQRRNEAGDEMRLRIVDAALRTVVSGGYASTSVRSIAATGGFSPALVFYHFGSVDALLLAVLDRVSADRLARYETRLANVPDLRALGAAMEELYSEDLRLGQLTAVQEIVGAMAFDPVLGDEIGRKMQPWLTFAEQLAARIIAGSPLAGFVDPSVIGSAVIALYMGLEIVARMRGGDSSGSSALMTTLVQAAPWIDQLLGKATPGRRRPATTVAIE